MNRTFSLLVLVCGAISPLYGHEDALSALERLESDPEIVEALGRTSLAFQLIFQSGVYRLSTGWLEGIIEKEKTSIAASMHEHIAKDETGLGESLMAGLREVAGSARQAKAHWVVGSEKRGEWLDRMLTSSRARMQLIEYLKERTVFTPIAQWADWMTTVHKLVLREIADDPMLLIEYRERALQFQPARYVWDGIVVDALSSQGDVFLQAIRRAAQMGGFLHQRFAESADDLVPVALQAGERSMADQVRADEVWREFTYWNLGRAAEAVVAVTRVALEDALPVHSTRAQVSVDDRTWTRMLKEAMRKPDSPFAEMIRSAIQRDDHCALTWARTMSTNDGRLADAFFNWMHEGMGRVEERWRHIARFVGEGAVEDLDALCDFRDRFVEFGKTPIGWERIANRLWIESSGPPQTLRMILARFMEAHPGRFWRAWEISLAVPAFRPYLKAHLTGWLHNIDLARVLIDQARHSGGEWVLADLWDSIMEEGLGECVEELIRQQLTGSPIYTLLLAVAQKTNVRTMITNADWHQNSFQKEWGRFVCGPVKAGIVADWIHMDARRMAIWENAVERKVERDPLWVRRLCEAIPGLAEMTVTSLASLLVGERFLFEQLLADPGGRFPTLIRKHPGSP